MKVPSRNMPKFVPSIGGKVTLGTGVLLVVLIAIFSPLSLIPIALIFAAAIVSWHFIDEPKAKAHFEKLFDARKDKSICDFSREFNCREVDTWVIRAVYEEVQKYVTFDKPVPLCADDSLSNDLLLDDDDLDLDLVEIISQRTGRKLENIESNPYYGRVDTVRDLVMFFNHQALTPRQECRISE